MSSRTSRDRASRAEARRRARQAARGEVADTDEETGPESEMPDQREGLLRRIFPPAPPLPDKPDPLRGFDRDGSMTPVRERLFLLSRNPAVWILLGLLAGVSFLATLSAGDSILALLATFVQFGALIAAGWFGWQRPTLYGVAAALVAFVSATSFIVASFAAQGAGPDAFGDPAALAVRFLFDGLYFAAFGFLGGWYGGYLRRRQAQVKRDLRSRR